MFFLRHSSSVGESVKPFIAAGDNPQYRDVIGVLRRLKQGLDRFKITLKTEHDIIQKQSDEILGLKRKDIFDLDLKSIFKQEDYIDPSIYDRLK